MTARAVKVAPPFGVLVALVLTACAGGTPTGGLTYLGRSGETKLYERLSAGNSLLEVVATSRDGADLLCDSTQPVTADQSTYNVACNGSVGSEAFVYVLPVRSEAVTSHLSCAMSDGSTRSGGVVASTLPQVAYEVVSSTTTVGDGAFVTTCQPSD